MTGAKGEPDPATQEAAAFDFVADYLDDEAAGAVRPLADYLARYPGCEAAVAAEYLRLQGDAVASDSGGGRDAGADEAQDDGRQRLGHYVLLRELGRGGQGAVWLAEDEQLGRRVALKLLSSPFVTEERRGRFRREAESIARLDHPGLAGVHDADLDGDLPWIAMRHVEGVDLRAALDAAREAGDAPRVAPLVPWIPRRRADVARVLLYFERAARALHAAHEEGVVHRDIKPGNLMVMPTGEPVLLDFGLARDVAPRDEAQLALTRDGELFGTPSYMAPEQISGDPRAVDRRADVWSLGVTLYEALTGERPFAGDAPHALAMAILTQPVPDPRQRNDALTRDLVVVLETALERDPARRYASALELAEDLRRIREFEPIRARPAGPALRLARWCRREPAWAAAIAVALLALVLGLALQTYLLGIARRALDQSNARLHVSQVAELQEQTPAGALALALEAVDLADEWWTRSALYGPLEALRLERVLEMPVGRVWDAVLFDSGQRVVASAQGGHLAVFDLVGATPPVRAQVAGVSGETEDAGEEPPGIRRLALARDGRGVVTGADDGVVRRYSLPELALEWEVDLDAGPVAWFARAPAELLAEVAAATGEDEARADARVYVLTVGGAVATLDDGSGALLGRFEIPARSAAELAVVRHGPDGRIGLAAGPRWRSGFARLGDDQISFRSLTDGRPGGGPGMSLGIRRFLWREDGLVVGTARGGVWRAEYSASGELGELLPWPGAALPAGARLAPVQCLEPFAPDHLLVGAPPGAPSWIGARTGGDGLALGEGALSGVLAADAASGAVACQDGRVRLLDVDVERGEVRVWREFRSAYQEDRVLALGDGERVLSFGVSRFLQVWRGGPDDDCWRLAPDADAPDPVVAAVPLAAPLHALSAHASGALRAWGGPVRSRADRRERGDGARVIHRHGDGPALLAVSADGGLVASSGANGALHLWSADAAPLASAPGTEGPRPARALRSPARALALAPDGAAGALLRADGTVIVLRRDGTGGAFEVPGGTALALSPGGHVALVGTEDGEVVVVDVRRPDARRRHVPEAGARVERPGRAAVRSVAVSPDGRRVLAASHDTWLDEWWVESGALTAPDAAGALVRWCAYLGEGRRVLALGEGALNASVRRAPAFGGAGPGDVAPARLHDGGHNAFAVSRDGALVATASEDGTVLVWEAATGATVARYAGHRAAVTAVSFGAGGMLVTGAADGEVARWPLDPTPLARRLAPRGLTRHERQRLGAGGE